MYHRGIEDKKKMKKKYWLFLVLILADVLIGTKVYGVISANKTWQSSEILTASDLNAEYTHNRAHIKENRDMILGDSAEGTGYSGHDHEGTNGVRIDADAMADDDWGDFSSSSQVFSLDADVVAGPEIANGDYGDLTFSDGNAALDAGVVDQAELNQDLIAIFGEQRARFIYSDTDTIKINAGQYIHCGTTNQIVYWNSQLTYDFTGLSSDTWSYLYIDDSAVVTAGTNLLTASEFIDSNTAPSWSHTKHGWYNGSDKCIFAVKTKAAASEILEFFHYNDFVCFADYILIGSGGVNDDWSTEHTLVIPTFCRKAKIHFLGSYGNTSTIFSWRTNGQSGTTGHYISAVASTSTYGGVSIDVITDSNLKIDVTESTASTGTLSVKEEGWYFPEGM